MYINKNDISFVQQIKSKIKNDDLNIKLIGKFNPLPKFNTEDIVLCWEDKMNKKFCSNYKENTFSNSEDNILYF